MYEETPFADYLRGERASFSLARDTALPLCGLTYFKMGEMSPRLTGRPVQ